MLKSKYRYDRKQRHTITPPPPCTCSNLKDTLASLLLSVTVYQAKNTESDIVLNKTLVMKLAQNYDKGLLSLLMNSAQIKEQFFTLLDNGATIFRLNDFLVFINNRNFLPDSFTAYQNKIGLGVDKDHYLSGMKDVVLNFPFKDCVLEGGQTKDDQKRKEIFYNEILSPDQINRLTDEKVFVNWKRYTKAGETKVDNLKENDNLIIKGNNLVVLHCLKKRFAGKIKLIYIDPPYNTGNDSFGYNDRFNHSTWLVFMKNRLEVAKKLLSDDGSIFVQCDDNEQAYLKVLMDEVFGRKNFVATICWEKKYSPSNDAKWLSDNHDFILVYARKKINWHPYLLQRTKEMNARYTNPDNDPRGDWKAGGFSVKTYTKNYDYPITTPTGKVVFPPNGSCWQTSEENYKKMLKDNRIYFGKDGNSKPQIKQFLCEVQQGIVPKTFWKFDEVGHNQIGRQEIKALFTTAHTGLFSTPKPESLLKRILEISTKPGDIVLDYHLGSGTTAAVAHKMGRQYIGVEQMDYIKTVTVERLKKVIAGEQGGISKAVGWAGGGEFVYLELANDAQNFIDRVSSAKDDNELCSLFKEIKEKQYLNWQVKLNEIATIVTFESLATDEKKVLLISLVDKNALYVDYSAIVYTKDKDAIIDEDYKGNITKEDAKLTMKFYKG